MPQTGKPRSLYDIPVEVTCSLCGEVAKVPLDKFSSDGGSFICKVGGHEFPLSQEKANKILGDHTARLDRIRNAI